MDPRNWIIIALVVMLAGQFVFYRRRRQRDDKEQRAVIKQKEAIIKSRAWQQEILLFAKDLGRTPKEDGFRSLLIEMSRFFAGKVKVVVSDDGRVLPEYSWKPATWNLQHDKEPIPPHERIFVYEKGDISVRIESNKPFCYIEGDEVLDSWFAVTHFAEAIWDNARSSSGERVLANEVNIDDLTGLLNRKGLTDRLNEEVERAVRYIEPLALAVMDLNEFKPINDTYGHDVGDEFLKAVAGVIKKEDRWEDISSRWGGDEFVLIYPNTDEKGARTSLARIKKGVANIRVEAAPGVRTGISIGIATLKAAERVRKDGHQDQPRPEVLFRLADEAMYQSKRMPRNPIVVWRKPREQ